MLAQTAQTAEIISAPDLIIDLRFCRYLIFSRDRLVRTIFPDGLYCDGSRDELDQQNIREAESEGYSGPLAVWRSLVEHELLHNLVADIMFNQPSCVMRTEAKGEFTPLYLRYQEEMLCLALQFYFNTNKFVAPLSRYNVEYLCDVWKKRYVRLLEPIWSLG